jgi:hypothetical protein
MAATNRAAYGLTDKNVEKILQRQQGLCGICGGDIGEGQIDHDHVTGRVRGILCRGCNVSLGHYERFALNRQGWADKLRAYLAQPQITPPEIDWHSLWVPKPGEPPLAAASRRLAVIARGVTPRKTLGRHSRTLRQVEGAADVAVVESIAESTC